MIKIRKGRQIVLGLSHANLDRLRADGLNGAIAVKGSEIGVNVDIFITAAESEAAMMQYFAAGIGPNTKVLIDKRFKS